MSIGEDVRDPTSLFKELLWKWIELVRDRTAFDPGDGGWWYNERASLSVLAGAIWRRAGYAFEEYAAQKISERAAFRGRADLWFSLDKRSYAAEAKQCWPRIGPKALSHIASCQNAMNAAVRDARAMSRLAPGTRRLAIVFASPILPLSATTDLATSRLTIFRDEILKRFAAAAIAWTSVKNDVPRYKGYTYPAAFVLLKAI